MARASKICPRCPNPQPCPDHPKVAWEGSRRSERTISGSRQQSRARRILLKYEAICHVCGEGGASEVDHVVPVGEGGADDESNLRPIHPRPCHADKTAAEATRGRQRNR